MTENRVTPLGDGPPITFPAVTHRYDPGYRTENRVDTKRCRCGRLEDDRAHRHTVTADVTFHSTSPSWSTR